MPGFAAVPLAPVQTLRFSAYAAWTAGRWKPPGGRAQARSRPPGGIWGG